MLSSVQIRPLRIVCDAPPYEVVKAGERIGLRSPEDVRWHRQSAASSKTGRRKTLAGRLWHLLFAFGLPEIEEKCGCGGTLSERRSIRLRTLAGSEIRYALAQCGRCRTIVWDEKQTSEELRPSNRHGHA